MKLQKEARGEEYPEIDVEAIWNEFLIQEGIRSSSIRGQLAKVIAHIYRGVSRNRLQLYPDVKKSAERVTNPLSTRAHFRRTALLCPA